MSLVKNAMIDNPELADIKNWPQIDFDLLPKSKRKRSKKNWDIALAWSNGLSQKKIAGIYNVSESSVSRLLSRCFTKDDDGQYYLTRAIVTRNILVAPERVDEAPTKLNGRGNRCAFSNLLKTYIELKLLLVSMIIAYLNKESWSQNLSAKRLHSEMMAFLRRADHSLDEYPYNTKSKGYESIRRFFIAEVNRQTRSKPNSVKYTSRLPKYSRALREIQIDSQVTDISTHIKLMIGSKSLCLRLSRVSLLIAICVDTGCILGWHLALTRAPSQLDMLQILHNIFAPWEKWEIQTPGLSYTHGAGFPSGIIPNFHCAGLNTVSLDNAWIHQAESVIQLICNEHGGVTRYGPPGTPIVRNHVEHGFNIANKAVSHRFASTSGSHPKDPKKESLKNSKSPPLLSLPSFEEAIEVSIAEYNSSPKAKLAGLTPLEAIQDAFETQPVRMNFGAKHKPVDAFSRTTIKTVYCSRKELRRPHVSCFDLKYSSPDFVDRNLGGSEVVFKYDMRDIRVVTISKTDGTPLGTLSVPATHRHRPLGYKVWEEIKEFEREYWSLGHDPVAGLVLELLEKKESPSVMAHILTILRGIEVNGKVVLPRKSEKVYDLARWYNERDDTAPDMTSWRDNLRSQRGIQ